MADTKVTLNAGDTLEATGAQPVTTSQPDQFHVNLVCATVAPPPPPPGNFARLDQFSIASPNPGGGRAGDLGVQWGASRLSGNQNLPGPANGWVSTPNDISISGGVLHDSVSDGGTVTCLAMYPKQPFDFAGRTGVISFDVGNDTQGNHAAWPELWMSDTPVPTPFAHESSLTSVPRHGFGIRFAGATDANGNGATPTRGVHAVGVDSAIVVNSYVPNDSFAGGALRVFGIDSVIKGGPGFLNHYEVQVSSSLLDVYGTDPYPAGQGNPNPLRHIARIPCSLSLTRGLVWIEDAHYNGDKFGTQGTHTFQWDNVGFDGPVLAKDLGFDVLDNTGSGLGYFVGPNSTLTLTTTAMTQTNINSASAALLVFGFYHQTAPITLTALVNGNSTSIPWAYPDTSSFRPRTLDVTISTGSLVVGPNTVQFQTGNFGVNIFNVSLILRQAGG